MFKEYEKLEFKTYNGAVRLAELKILKGTGRIKKEQLVEVGRNLNGWSLEPIGEIDGHDGLGLEFSHGQRRIGLHFYMDGIRKQQIHLDCYAQGIQREEVVKFLKEYSDGLIRRINGLDTQ